MSDEEDYEERKPRKGNFFDDALPMVQRNESLKVSASGVSYTATASDNSRFKGTNLPATSMPVSRPSLISRESPVIPDLGRTSASSGTPPLLTRPSTTTSVTAARESASKTNSTLPVNETVSNRPFTALAQSQASLISQRRQSFMSPQPTTNPVEAVRLLLVNGDSEQNHRRDSPIVYLENFKGLAAKKKLLSAALATHDGNVILTVLRFLRSTLSFDLFVSMLQSDPNAARQYLIYLKQCGNTNEVNTLVTRLETVDPGLLEKDQIENAARLATEIKQKAIIEKFASLTTIVEPDRRKDAFYKFAREEAANSPALADFAKKTAILIEIQQKLDSVESIESRSQNFVYTEFPLSGSAIGKTLGETLRHCAVYHLSIDPVICPNCEKKEPPIHLNAACLKKTFNVSDKIFQVALTRALTQSRRYELIDKVLAPKGIASFFSGATKKVKPAVAPERAIDVIMFTLKQWNRLGVSLPANIRAYLTYVEDQDTMECLARDYQIYDIVTEVYCQKKDRQRLVAFIGSIPPSHPEYERAKYRLLDPSIKWKN